MQAETPQGLLHLQPDLLSTHTDTHVLDMQAMEVGLLPLLLLFVVNYCELKVINQSTTTEYS